MERDKHVAIVADSGSSIRQDSPEAKELGVTIVPLALEFYEHGNYVPYSDAEITSDDFYKRMETAGKMLPKTSGAVPGSFVETFRNLRQKAKSIISINITSKLSGVWDSAVLAKNIISSEPGPETEYEIVDTGKVSLASWFPVETAKQAIERGASLKEIRQEIEEVINKTQLFCTLETFENLKNGGRGSDILKAILATTLSLYPVIGFENGKLKNFAMIRHKAEKAREKMIEMLGDAGKLVKLAVVHTNVPDTAVRIRQELINRKIFKGIIPIYEAGPVLAVHAGPGAIAFAFQKA